jgi:hypothetical protein
MVHDTTPSACFFFDHVDVSTLERADRSRLLLRSFLTNACVVPFHEQEAGSTRQSAR